MSVSRALATGGALSGSTTGTAFEWTPLHGGAPGGGPYLPVLAVSVVALWLVVAALVVGVDRLLARVDVE